MQTIENLEQDSKIELSSRKKNIESYQLITEKEQNRSPLEFLKKYPEIDLFSREKSFEYYQLITEKVQNKSPLAYLLALGIPFSSALTIACKLISDSCRVIDTIIQSIAQKEYAGGNIQTLAVDGAEYGRSIFGMLGGALVGLFSPGYAAETFLTIAADPAKTFLTSDEGARLYAMGDRLHDFFVRQKIDYRICSGTALGALREGGIIRNDDDIDLMIHPDSVSKLKKLIENGTLALETGISIETQPLTGGWQCFYSDSPKGKPGTPTELIGKPFVDIFPGTRRLWGEKQIITYGENTMYLQSKGDHFTDKEWDTPTLYAFGPTKLFGVESNAMKDYIARSYGTSALKFKTRLYPHEVYSQLWSSPLSTYSILSKHPSPRYMRQVSPAPLDFDKTVYDAKRALDTTLKIEDLTPILEEKRIWVDGIFDLFHQGHKNVINNAMLFTENNHPNKKITLLIGVCADGKDVQDYKRKPIMTLEERCKAIDLFMKKQIKEHPNVSYQIIPNSPVTHTLKFIQENRLNILFHGSDFTEKQIDEYYGVIRKECKKTCSFEILPRTEGVSTTKLIRSLLNEGDFGKEPNATGLSLDELSDRVKQRSDEFQSHSIKIH